MMTNRTSRYSVSTVQAAADARGAGRHDQRHRDERSRHERRELADECRTDWRYTPTRVGTTLRKRRSEGVRWPRIGI